MSAPDFFFAVNEIFRHIHDRYGKGHLIEYWQMLGRDYYRRRNARWAEGGVEEIARDWREYFQHEPCAQVDVDTTDQTVVLDIHVCPAIHHLRQGGRDIVPYFCEHCDHVCSAQAEAAGFRFTRVGGMGTCRQTFTRLTVKGRS